MKNQTFEDFLYKYFVDLREINGVAIIKDNVEDMFDRWLQNHDIQDIIELGELYGKSQFLAGKDKVLNNINI